VDTNRLSRLRRNGDRDLPTVTPRAAGESAASQGGRQMTTQSKAAVLTEIIESFCAKDLDRLRTLIDDQVVYLETGTGRRIEGADAYIALCQGWLAAFPDIGGKVTSGLEAGNQAAIEVIWTGTNNGPIAMPDGEVPATGKPIDLNSSIWATFNGDKVVEVRHHLDIMGMVQQLGIAG
jgi:steroid delta-isomerase-like uncharacterized protein